MQIHSAFPMHDGNKTLEQESSYGKTQINFGR